MFPNKVTCKSYRSGKEGGGEREREREGEKERERERERGREGGRQLETECVSAQNIILI